eukprot:SAG31_NODE_653_length_13152_cov_4.899487_5_plen_214_part_00
MYRYRTSWPWLRSSILNLVGHSRSEYLNLGTPAVPCQPDYPRTVISTCLREAAGPDRGASPAATIFLIRRPQQLLLPLPPPPQQRRRLRSARKWAALASGIKLAGVQPNSNMNAAELAERDRKWEALQRKGPSGEPIAWTLDYDHIPNPDPANSDESNCILSSERTWLGDGAYGDVYKVVTKGTPVKPIYDTATRSWKMSTGTVLPRALKIVR